MDIKPSPKVNINVKSYTNSSDAKINESNFDFNNTSYSGIEEPLYTDEQFASMDSAQYTDNSKASEIAGRIGSVLQGSSNIIQSVNSAASVSGSTSAAPHTADDLRGEQIAMQGAQGDSTIDSIQTESIDELREEQRNTIRKQEEMAERERQEKERQKKVEKKIKELLSSIRDKAVEGSEKRTFTDTSGNWCAKYATWAWKNAKIDGVSAYDIAKLDGVNTNSTGELMMHFYNAKKEGNNNIEFYYNDRLDTFNGKNADKLAEGEKNYTPKPGDYAFFAWTTDDNNGRANEWKPYKGDPYNGVQSHTALVKSVETDDNGNVIGITVIEGNVPSFRERSILFDKAGHDGKYGDKYADGLIGYGTIKDLPDSVNVDD